MIDNIICSEFSFHFINNNQKNLKNNDKYKLIKIKNEKLKQKIVLKSLIKNYLNIFSFFQFCYL